MYTSTYSRHVPPILVSAPHETAGVYWIVHKEPFPRTLLGVLDAAPFGSPGLV